MIVEFLGTSAGWPLPRLGCHCQICRSSNLQDKRSRPSILINNCLLFDCGPDFYHQFLPFSSLPLKAIFISHAHPDHYFGLWDAAKIYHQKPEIFLSAKTKESILKQTNDLTFIFLLRKAKNFQPGQTIKINNLKITPFLVEHSASIETYGFQIAQNKKFLVYIPDFKNLPSDSKRFIKGANLAIWDGSSIKPAGPTRWGHIPIVKSIPLAKRLKIQNVYYTHIGHGKKSAPHQELENYVQKHGGKNFHIAFDSLKIKI